MGHKEQSILRGEKWFLINEKEEFTKTPNQEADIEAYLNSKETVDKETVIKKETKSKGKS